MIAVRMVQAPIDQVVDVIVMRDGLVPASLTVGVTGRAADRLGMTSRVPDVHRDDVLIDVIAVRVVEMAFVEIVDVIIVAHRDMTTPISVDVRVVALVNGMRHAAERTRRGPY